MPLRDPPVNARRMLLGGCGPVRRDVNRGRVASDHGMRLAAQHAKPPMMRAAMIGQRIQTTV